jgi:hypothetical protein
MITSREYRQFARECAKWATETDADEDRISFLALAKDWTFAAIALIMLKNEGSKDNREAASLAAF